MVSNKAQRIVEMAIDNGHVGQFGELMGIGDPR